MATTMTRTRSAKALLGPPVLLKAGGSAIDVDIGHAAPFVAWLDGENRPSLLVGQFGEGKLRIYRDTGTKRSPRLDPDFSWFKAGRKPGTVPFG